MRILHAVSSIDPVQGGVVASVLDRGKILERLGHQVEIVTADAPDAECVLHCPLPAHAVGPGLGRYAKTSGMSPWIRENAHRFDAVVADGIWQHNLPAARDGVAGTQTPLFVFSHGMLDPWFKKRYPLKHLKKTPYWMLVAHPSLAAARAVFFTCEEERRLAHRAFWPYNFAEAIVPLGVEVPEATSSAKSAFELEAPQMVGRAYLLFLSRIHPKKGCDLLLHAFAKSKNTDRYLVMAGPDPENWRPELESLAHRLGIADRVVWTGMLSGEAKWAAYAGAEAFVLPSHQENFGVVVAEALAYGKPVLITTKVNIWREISEQGAGLVADDDQAGIDRLIDQWDSLDESGRRSMANNARTCFDRNFKAEQAARTFVDVISELGRRQTP